MTPPWSATSSGCRSATPSRQSPRRTPAPPGNCSTGSWRKAVHERAVAQALVEQVDAVIDQHQAHHDNDASSSDAWRATSIRVRIGPLAGVVPELLATAFPLAAAGSRLG